MFHQIPFSDESSFWARMASLLQTANYQLPSANGNFAFGVKFGWADMILINRAVLPCDSLYKNTKEFVEFRCYLGNTKHQGKELFKHSRDWTKKTELFVSNIPYNLDIDYHVKFCTVMSNYETSLDFREKDLRGDLNPRKF